MTINVRDLLPAAAAILGIAAGVAAWFTIKEFAP